MADQHSTASPSAPSLSVICNRCLRFVAHCECAGGPRTQRHPSDCLCAMCSIGRGDYDERAEELRQ